MRVGIITFQWANNFGALLQAHASCQRLAALGHEPTVINYTPENCRAPWWKGWGLNCGRQMPAYAIRRFRFERFRRHVLPLSRPCHTTEELSNLATSFDAVIVGSDQVWNGHIVGRSDAHYFLDFVSPETTALVSYAACFGDPDQPEHTQDTARLSLSRFHAISVRNEMSAALVRSLGDRDAEISVDPTMLHDFSDIQCPSPVAGPYIAAYYVSPDHASHGKAVVRHLSEHLRLPVVAVGSDRKILGADQSYVEAGPTEWVGALRNAAFVCTDSFHGSIFALKFRKPFVVWPGYRTGRLTHLLGHCGLSDRLLAPDAIAEARELADRGIDFESVEARLVPWIAQSTDYLSRALASTARATA